MKKYLIIGNGAAATGCVEGIRSVDTESPITIVSAEDEAVYCRPLISYYLEGKTDPQKMRYRCESFYEDNHCEVLYGHRAVSLDPSAKTVTLEDESVLDYDAVCVATGSSPFVPPMDGLATVKEQYPFMTLADAKAVEASIDRGAKEKTRVLIIGAGLIGLKCAEGLRDRVASITVCDLADRILSSILDEEDAARMQKHLEEQGLTFLLQDSVASFDGQRAIMKSGAEVSFDLLILAVGVRANLSLVRDAGGACRRGITIDARSKTSLDSVYAAGDCTESQDISDDTVKVMALMPNAYMQGHAAGVNMAGGDEVFDLAIPMNSLGLFGCHVMTAGSHTVDEKTTIYEEKEETSIKKLYVRDDRLVGFILLGKTDRAGIYTDLIRHRVPLDGVDFEILKKNPNLFAFSQKKRRKILGGVV
jgi:NAD(P)H-nitrite reductase large subunit